MRVVPLDSFGAFKLVTALHSKSIVIVDGIWTKAKGCNFRSKVYDSISKLEAKGLFDHDFVVFHVYTDGKDELTEFVLEILHAASLPLLCTFTNGLYKKVYTLQDFNKDSFTSLDNSLVDLVTLLKIFLPLKSDDNNNNNSCLPIATPSAIPLLFNVDKTVPVGKVFLSGDKSSVGKSTMCFAILSGLVKMGVDPADLAYIKPVTQCEAEQLVVRYCAKVGIAHVSVSPIVFYKGFTRAFLAGETEPVNSLLQHASDAVEAVSRGKKLTLIDGVGYPSVGSICSLSNADVSRHLKTPVLLIGKSGVGDAVDSYNLNAQFFETQGSHVLGGVFNKLALDGFYSLESCKEAVSSYFNQYKKNQRVYGFVPSLELATDESGSYSEASEKIITDTFLKHVNLSALVIDIWRSNLLLKAVLVGSLPLSPSLGPLLASVPTTRTNNKNSNNNNNNNYVRLIDSSLVNANGARKRSREEVEIAALKQGAKKGG